MQSRTNHSMISYQVQFGGDACAHVRVAETHVQELHGENARERDDE